MTWELSISQTGLDNVRGNIAQLDAADLLCAYVETQVYYRLNSDDTTSNFDSDLYDKLWAKAYKDFMRGALAIDTLAETVSAWTIELIRTMENGGYEVWICPYGCHTVSTDLECDHKRNCNCDLRDVD